MRRLLLLTASVLSQLSGQFLNFQIFEIKEENFQKKKFFIVRYLFIFSDDEDFEGSGESSGDFDPTCKSIFLVFST